MTVSLTHIFLFFYSLGKKLMSAVTKNVWKKSSMVLVMDNEQVMRVFFFKNIPNSWLIWAVDHFTIAQIEKM